MKLSIKLDNIDDVRNIVGIHNQNLKMLEEVFNIQVDVHGDQVLTDTDDSVILAKLEGSSHEIPGDGQSVHVILSPEDSVLVRSSPTGRLGYLLLDPREVSVKGDPGVVKNVIHCISDGVLIFEACHLPVDLHELIVVLPEIIHIDPVLVLKEQGIQGLLHRIELDGHTVIKQVHDASCSKGDSLAVPSHYDIPKGIIIKALRPQLGSHRLQLENEGQHIIVQQQLVHNGTHVFSFEHLLHPGVRLIKSGVVP